MKSGSAAITVVPAASWVTASTAARSTGARLSRARKSVNQFKNLLFTFSIPPATALLCRTGLPDCVKHSLTIPIVQFERDRASAVATMPGKRRPIMYAGDRHWGRPDSR